jgi:3-hydroxyisobutyrate dehydrogenase-like beta-hydroxyacid dehydrogenase
MTNTLAIIAAGAMGSAIARRMAENGARVLTSLKGRSQATVDRAHQAGMISASDEEIAAHAELVLSVVPPGEALALAERLQPVFERQSRRPIFMDCNAVNPSTLDRIRAAIGQDEHFLDTCIIGSPPKPGGPSPTLYVCGRPCHVVERRTRRACISPNLKRLRQPRATCSTPRRARCDAFGER